MRSTCTAALAAIALVCAGPVGADDPSPPEMSPEEAAMWAAFEASMTPGDPHAFLAAQAGEFVATVRNFEDPAGEPEVSESQVVRTMELDGRVLREVWSGTVMGMPFEGIGRTGYDNVTQRYWTTWTDNLSTGVFVAYGHRDANTGVMEFKGDMPDPMSGKMIPTRSVATHGDDVETMTMYRVAGGEDIKTMEFEVRRK